MLVDAGKVAETLNVYRNRPRPFKALIGLDGFVDEILRVVDKRQSAESFTAVGTLSALGERISRAAGLSTNIELVGVTRKLGGNGPNMVNALAGQGVRVTYIGALGETSIHDVFRQMGEACELIPIADPALSFNLEFEDGKLIMSKLDSFQKITWSALEKRFGLEKLSQMIGGGDLDLFGLENWTMIPYMSDVFKGIIDNVFPLIKPGNCLAFFDLCDPEKRLMEDLTEALGLIRQFSARFRVVLGLNLKEAAQVADALGLDVRKPEASIEDVDLEEITVKIGEAMGVYCLVIHTVTDAGTYSDGAFHYSPGYYTPHPKLTTGAGDNFNAGSCLGLLMNLSVGESLLLGAASSGFYVREARSANLLELIGFLSNVEAV